MTSTDITRAFILGAGLGKRLRPLTENLPKPLIPVNGRPMVTYGLDHLAKNGVRDVIINTHHAAERWKEFFPDGKYQNMKVSFRHEPTLLDTGGGIKNVEDFFLKGKTFFIYNGDILTSVPLEKAVEDHQKHQRLVTMVLRGSGGPKHVALGKDGKIDDIRGLLGTGRQGEYVFTGIHVVEPKLFEYIPKVEIKSIIPIYLELIQKGLSIGGVVLDEGEWSDLGTLEEYERVNQQKSYKP